MTYVWCQTEKKKFYFDFPNTSFPKPLACIANMKYVSSFHASAPLRMALIKRFLQPNFLRHAYQYSGSNAWHIVHFRYSLLALSGYPGNWKNWYLVNTGRCTICMAFRKKNWMFRYIFRSILQATLSGQSYKSINDRDWLGIVCQRDNQA